MRPLQFMVIAGETSGDALAAELVRAVTGQAAKGSQPTPVFFGAGGPAMAAEGVQLSFDMTAHSVVGLWEVVKNYGKFKRLFDQLLELAGEKKPDAIICVDFSGFNRRFAHAVKERVREGKAGRWNPRLIQFVSPQVWASRPGRAAAMAQDFDLLLSIFPFEQPWYAKNAPELRVEFVGHPILDRYPCPPKDQPEPPKPTVLLLPGSRVAELKRHLPPMLGAWQIIRQKHPAARAAMVLPNENLHKLAAQLGVGADIAVQIGQLPEALGRATIAIASTGTVTVECAYFGVPTVTLYKTSWSTYQIAKRIVRVKSLTMPNILADAPVFPEFIQNEATAAKLARAALEFLGDASRRAETRRALAKIIDTLGSPGAAERGAEAIWKVMKGTGKSEIRNPKSE